MIEEVYDFLREYGFTKEEVNYFEDENDDMYFTNMVEVNKNIDFLINKGLNKEEIMQVFRVDPFMITVKNNRLDALDKIYIEDLKLNKDELKQLIIDNPDAYIVSVTELNKNIDYLKEHNYPIETIKKFFITNPQLISMSNEEFVSIVKFN